MSNSVKLNVGVVMTISPDGSITIKVGDLPIPIQLIDLRKVLSKPTDNVRNELTRGQRAGKALRKRAQKRREAGICHLCDKKVVKDKRLCPEHLQKKISAIKHFHSKLNGKTSHIAN